MVKRAALAGALALNPDIRYSMSLPQDSTPLAAVDQLLVTLRDAMGFSVFGHPRPRYPLCGQNRVAVLSQKRVLVVDTLENVAKTDDEWYRLL